MILFHHQQPFQGLRPVWHSRGAAHLQELHGALRLVGGGVLVIPPPTVSTQDAKQTACHPTAHTAGLYPHLVELAHDRLVCRHLEWGDGVVLGALAVKGGEHLCAQHSRGNKASVQVAPASCVAIPRTLARQPRHVAISLPVGRCYKRGRGVPPREAVNWAGWCKQHPPHNQDSPTTLTGNPGRHRPGLIWISCRARLSSAYLLQECERPRVACPRKTGLTTEGGLSSDSALQAAEAPVLRSKARRVGSG